MKTLKLGGLAAAALLSLGIVFAIPQVQGGTTGGKPPVVNPPIGKPKNNTTKTNTTGSEQELPITAPLRPSQMRLNTVDPEFEPVLEPYGYPYFLPARMVIDQVRQAYAVLSVNSIMEGQRQAYGGGAKIDPNAQNGGQTTGQTGGQTTGQTGGNDRNTGGQTGGSSQTAGMNGGQTGGQTSQGQTGGTQTTTAGQSGGQTGGQTTGQFPPNQQGQPANPNAFAGPVGPLNLGNLLASPPETYQLGPGDQLLIRVWSPTMELQEFNLRIDQNGGINAPGTQKRVILRGLNLEGVRRVLLREARLAYRDADVTVQLGELRTFSVSVLGESYAPGTYQVPATFSLFNLVYITGGPSENGSLRRIQLKRVNGQTRTFDFYAMLRGDNSQDVALQPGDTIVIPAVRIRVAVKGEVVRPAYYELVEGERLKDAILFAEGVKATGVAQNISVDSVVPGSERRLINADLAQPGEANNPQLFDGDVVEVFSIRPAVLNAVAVEGAVDQPRAYALKEGMTVLDLLNLARGVLPDAYTKRADLYRLTPDENYTLIELDLAKVLARDPKENMALLPDDKLRIYRISEVEFLQEQVVTVEGAVKNPGKFYRANGTKVRDILIQAGGLAPDASMESAFLQRVNPDGTYGELVTVDLLKAQSGDPLNNVELQNRDILKVLTTLEAKPTPDQMVEVAGAVQRPGLYPLGSNMRVADLVRLAGNPNFNAFLEKAFIQRFNLNGTPGPLEIVNLQAALSGDSSHNLQLQPKDRVMIYTIDQAQQQPSQNVTIAGAVQQPGVYPRSSNMTLASLIRLAGGLKRNAGDRAEIARSRVDFGTPIESISLDDALKGDYSGLESIVVQDGDVVTIPANSDYLEKPILVVIQGEVKRPGTYAITDRNVKLSDVLERAGGPTASAWLRGGQFARDPKFLASAYQTSLTPRLQEIFRQIGNNEYSRAVARTELDKARIAAQTGQTIGDTGQLFTLMGMPTAPYVQPKAVPAANAASAKGARIIQVNELVTRARETSKFENVQGGNLYVNFEEATRRQGSPENIILKDGDVITIPEIPSVVFVDGPGIMFNQGVVFKPGKSLGYYIEQVGGLTVDAAKDQILVVRPSGVLYKPRMSTKIEAGDMIYVPTKVMVAKLTDNQNNWENIFKMITNGALIYGIFRNITGG